MRYLIILLAIMILPEAKQPEFAHDCANCETLQDYNYDIGGLYE